MKPILFPVDGVRELIEFTWDVLERKHACRRQELREWPELVFHASVEFGVLLFPLLGFEDREDGMVVYAFGCDPAVDDDWESLVRELEEMGWAVFSIHVECFCLEIEAENFKIGFEKDGPRVLH